MFIKIYLEGCLLVPIVQELHLIPDKTHFDPIFSSFTPEELVAGNMAEMVSPEFLQMYLDFFLYWINHFTTGTFYGSFHINLYTFFSCNANICFWNCFYCYCNV